jgi:hypothetical protein
VFQSYDQVLLAYQKVKTNVWHPATQHLEVKHFYKSYGDQGCTLYSKHHHVDYKNNQSQILLLYRFKYTVTNIVRFFFYIYSPWQHPISVIHVQKKAKIPKP